MLVFLHFHWRQKRFQKLWKNQYKKNDPTAQLKQALHKNSEYITL